MRTRSAATAAAAALLAVCAGSCAGAITPKDKLEDVAYPFYDDWRWKHVAGLAKRIEPSEREEFAKQYATATTGVEFADYEITDIEVLEGGLTAEVTVTFHWYAISDMTLNEAQIIETWERKGKAKPWFRVSQAVILGSMP